MTKSFRIVSWNIHGLPAPFSKRRATRMQNLAREIGNAAPQLAMLQEAWGSSLRLLSAELPAWRVLAIASRQTGAAGGLAMLLPRDDGWKATAPPCFRRFSAQAPRWKLWQGDGAAGKGALFVTLADEDGERLTVVTTHLQSRYPGQDYAAIRVAQLRELAAWLRNETSLLLAGDFNTPSGDPEYHEHIAPLGFDATAGARTADPSAVTNYATRSSAAWIDFVLLRAPGAVSAVTRLIRNRDVDDPYSDHHGVVTDVRW
jgi:endonuclease/exonuclease/phosphatase family metal-dependent hydrolase